MAKENPVGTHLTQDANTDAVVPTAQGELLIEKIGKQQGSVQVIVPQAISTAKEVWPILTDTPEPQFVGRAQSKPNGGIGFRKVELNVKKLAVIIPYVDEWIDDIDVNATVIVNEELVYKFAKIIDAHILGWLDQEDIETEFDSSLRDAVESTGQTLALEDKTEHPDRLSRSVRLAVAKLIKRGSSRENIVVVFTADAEEEAVLASSSLDGSLALYPNGLADVTKQQHATSVNLPWLDEESEEGKHVAYVFDRTDVQLRIRTDLQTKVSDQAAITMNGELVSAFENNLTLVRLEMRPAFAVIDEKGIYAISDEPGNEPSPEE